MTEEFLARLILRPFPRDATTCMRYEFYVSSCFGTFSARCYNGFLVRLALGPCKYTHLGINVWFIFIVFSIMFIVRQALLPFPVMLL